MSRLAPAARFFQDHLSKETISDMTDGDLDFILSRLKEAEELLGFPSVPGHVERALTLALWLSRNAPNANVATLGMALVREIDRHRLGHATITATGKGAFRNLLDQLRDALMDLHPRDGSIH